jgi:hypothetical protein
VRDDVVELASDPTTLLGDRTIGRRDGIPRVLWCPFHRRDASATVDDVEVQRIDEGLWRWTTAHPDWHEGDDWGREVGCVYWEAEDTVVLVDPLVPSEEADRTRFLEALDRDVARLGRPVAIVLTCEWHERSAAELTDRYGASVHRAGGAADSLPRDVVAYDIAVAREIVYWLPGARAVVPGDVLLGTEGGLALCPEPWLERRGGHARLVSELAPLLELPVERVLTSHGAPTLTDGRAALQRALGAVR